MPPADIAPAVVAPCAPVWPSPGLFFEFKRLSSHRVSEVISGRKVSTMLRARWAFRHVYLRAYGGPLAPQPH